MVKTSPASASDAGLIPGWGVKIPHGSQQKKKQKTSILKKKKQYCNKFNKDFKNSPHQKKNFFFKWRGTRDSECKQDFQVFRYKRGRVQ